MPHARVRLVDGVNTNRTPTLNEYALTSCQAIRYQYDNQNNILVQKLGGWTRYWPNTMTAIVRALWGWENTEADQFLAIGTQNISGELQAQLLAIDDSNLSDITPRQSLDNVTVAASTTAGSAVVTITDATTQNITQFDSVYIPTHISVGGLVLFGLYQCSPVDGTHYTVTATDVLGNALPAASTTSAAALAKLTTTANSTLVTVTLNNHGYNVGDLFPILVPTRVGGATFFSHYPVQSVTDANNFVIVATETPNASTNGYINNDFAQFIYGRGVGSISAGAGYGTGGYGSGGYGRSVASPLPGSPISAANWFLSNWGEELVASAVESPIVLAITGASGTGVTGTLTFTPSTYTPPANGTITVAGCIPTSWNGIWQITSSSAGSVSFSTTNTSALTTNGTITVGNAPFSPIYVWDSEGGAPTAELIPQAPPVNAGCFVAMPQRQIVAWGSTFTGIQDPLLLRWCDINNFNQWIALVGNSAGSYRLPKGSRIVGAIQGPQQALIWTDIDVWSMQFIGGDLVYSFNEIGAGCGLIGSKAAASVNGLVFWMGPSQFFVLGDSGAEPLPCPEWDFVFQNLDTANTELIRVAVNSLFNEIAWHFPTLSSGGEVGAYVKYNYQLGLWDSGTGINRSAWIDQSVLGPPIGADPNSNYIYQHETSPDADGQALMSSFRTGYFALDEGDQKVFVDQVWPDAKFGTYGGAQAATVDLSFFYADYPEDTPKQDGPRSVTASTQYITPRFRGRLIAFQLESNDVGSFWRIGAMRYRWQPDGKY